MCYLSTSWVLVACQTDRVVAAAVAVVVAVAAAVEIVVVIVVVRC